MYFLKLWLSSTTVIFPTFMRIKLNNLLPKRKRIFTQFKYSSFSVFILLMFAAQFRYMKVRAILSLVFDQKSNGCFTKHEGRCQLFF